MENRGTFTPKQCLETQENEIISNYVCHGLFRETHFIRYSFQLFIFLGGKNSVMVHPGWDARYLAFGVVVLFNPTLGPVFRKNLKISET